MSEPSNSGRAEESFRAAFERLKHGKPNLLRKGSKVSQNNVAKEAGVDPSALRKSRFPTLIAEIQLWVSEYEAQAGPKLGRDTVLGRRSASRPLRQRLAVAEEQRDKAMSALVDAEARLLELYIEIERLKALCPTTNVTPLRGGGTPRSPADG